MPVFTDQTGRTIEINSRPQRIVSLVPSQTELLYSLGLDKEVVGITKFCVHPQHWFKSKLRIGGTKTVNIQAIRLIEPDLIIANKEENVREQVEELAKDYPVWISDPGDLAEALKMVSSVGEITGTMNHARQLKDTVTSAFSVLRENINLADVPLRVAYLIWRNPYMVAGGDTFIHAMLQECGFVNSFEECRRYPQVTIQELRNSGCTVLLLSSEPYPFNQAHALELKAQLPKLEVVLVDGEMFSWYGSRLLLAPDYFRHLRSKLTGARAG